MEKLLIYNAVIASSTQVFRGAVLAENGKITKIYDENAVLPNDANKIDAQGKYLLPGGVDAHTHFDLDVGIARASDDFYTGSVAAACGGTTTVVDHMAFGPKGVPLTYQPKVYETLAKDSVVDYGFHGVVQHVDEDVIKDMEALKNMGITSLKLYMTYDYGLGDADILQVLARAKELDMVVCAHCENDAAIAALRQKFVKEGKTQPRYHALSRPPQAEAEAAFRLMMLSQISKTKIYIVHLSSKEGLSAIETVKQWGASNIIVETCPQYLLLDDELYQDDKEGLKYIMSPPLRKKADMEALWQALANGSIQTIGTDHCPFFFETQKQMGANNFTKCPNGAPGVELRMPLLFSEGYMKKRLSLERLVQVACSNPAQIFGIAAQKGDIKVGLDADFVLFDPTHNVKITKQMLHENVDYTPYEGIELTGYPVMTISRGEIIAKNGVCEAKKGRGNYVHRI